MQRILLLFLSVSLGVLVFLCSQPDFNLPILLTDSPKIQLKSFQPFHYAALHIETSKQTPEQGILSFMKEANNQKLDITEPLLIFKPDPENSQEGSWIIATKIPTGPLVEIDMEPSENTKGFPYAVASPYHLLDDICLP